MYIYQADCWCDDCGARIKAEIDVAGEAPENPQDEHSFDSDEYPKYADDDLESSDTPCHCGANDKCLNAEVLPSGRHIGCVLGGLTEYGIYYVLEQHNDRPNEVTEFWLDHFDLSPSDVL